MFLPLPRTSQISMAMSSLRDLSAPAISPETGKSGIVA
jgi:hypothetical protein